MVQPPALPAIFRLLWGDDESAILAPGEWLAIEQIGRTHRLRPLLHAMHSQGDIEPPDELRTVWAAAHQRTAMRALRMRATLVDAGRILAENGIEACVLKGGALVWRGWFEPALRPMRDLDLLVRADSADAAQEALVGAGFVAQGQDTSLKHLAPLRSPRGVAIEVHRHVMDPYGSLWRSRDEELREAIWKHAVPMPGIAGLSVPGDTETLLHVVVHGVIDSQLNNGPLLIHDILALLANGAIDWPRFWRTAERVGATRAAELALALAHSVLADAPIEWRVQKAPALPASVLEAAARLMLEETRAWDWAGTAGRALVRGWRGGMAIALRGLRRVPQRLLGRHEGRARTPQPGGQKAASRERYRVARWLASYGEES